MISNETKRSESSQNKYIGQQAALLELTSQLLRRHALEDVMSYVVKEVSRLVEADACALLLPDKQQGYLAFRATSGWRADPVVERRRVSAGQESSSGKAMVSQKAILSGSSVDRVDIPDETLAWLLEEEFEGVAIIPLLLREEASGAMIVSMRTPRDFNQDEVQFLQLMANQAAIAIEQAHLMAEALRRQRLESELMMGQRIQRNFLPASVPEEVGWQFDYFYRAARQVGGDFYDFIEFPGRKRMLGLVAGDVADKGVPAALFMTVSRTLIRASASKGKSPAKTLSKANRLILRNSQSELFVSAFYAKLELDSGRLTYANAGHNRPLWYRPETGDFQELAARGMVLCIDEHVDLEDRTIDLEPGDIIVIYTDGLSEAIDEQGHEFGRGRIQGAIAAHRHGTATEIKEAIVHELDAFTTDTATADDQTLIVIKRNDEGQPGVP